MRSTLDTLAFEAEAVTIVGEHDYAGARAPDRRARRLELERDRGGPLPPPAARPVRPLPARAPAAAPSGAASAAPRRRCGWSASRSEPWAAIGARAAAELYGCTILREGIEDEADNVTRFVWIAPARHRAGGRTGAWKTSLVFSELGEDHPGALVEALQRVLRPRRQPDPHRVAARCARASAATCSSATSREPTHDEAVARGRSTALRDQGRIGADPRFLSAS